MLFLTLMFDKTYLRYDSSHSPTTTPSTTQNNGWFRM